MENLLETMKKVGAAIEAMDRALEALAQAREALKKIGDLADEPCDEEVPRRD